MTKPQLTPRLLTAAFLTATMLAALIFVTYAVTHAITPVAAQNVSPAELLLKEAQHKQQVERDFTGAIKIYQQIADNKNSGRAVIASALLGLAGCYEKQGKLSEEVYRQIVLTYGDQPAAAVARRKLLALRPPAPATQTLSKIESAVPVSPTNTDGKRVIYRDAATGAIVIGDLAGKGKQVVYKPKPGERVSPLPSRDLSMVALLIGGQLGEVGTLAVIKADGTGYHEIGKLGPGRQPTWSWDNRYILYPAGEVAATTRLVVVSMLDRQTREVPRTENTAIFAAAFSPNGRFIAYAVGEAGSGRVFVIPSEGGESQIISEKATLLDWTSDGRYVAVASPHSGAMALQLLPVKDGKSGGEPVFVRYGSFGPFGGHMTSTGSLVYVPDPGGVLFPFWIADLDPDGRPGEWKSLDLGPNTRNIYPEWSPDSSQIVYTAAREDTGQTEFVVRLRTLATGDERDLYRGGMTTCHWAARASNLFCWEDAGGTTNILSIPVDSGRAERLASMQGVAILIGVFPDNQALFVLNLQGNLSRWDIGTHQETFLDRVHIETNNLAFEPSRDGAWLKQIADGNLEVRPMSGSDWKPLLRLRPDTQTGFSPDGKWIFFHDLDAAEKDGLYRVATGGGRPERVGDFPTSGFVGHLIISPDGRKIVAGAHATSFPPLENWLLENFVPKAPAAK